MSLPFRLSAALRGGTAALAALGLVVSGAASATAVDDPASGDSSPVDTAPVTDGPASTQHTFTLPTGDVVTARSAADGTLSATGLRSADGVDRPYTTFQDGAGGVFVLPEAAQAAIDAGLVDRRLFDINALFVDGYDDESTDRLPVIIEHDPAAQPDDVEGDGVDVTASLDSIDAVGATLEKAQAAETWERLTSGETVIESIWLDRKMRASATAAPLGTPTVPLTGAGAAHAAGLDGEGVTVAVLDTGYDPGHEDLKDRVIGAESFVWDGTVEDLNGHGTHVATTIAGSGFASQGRYAGMAPGADLLIGKVLDDSGAGQTSEIIAGMEWAVEAGADIVSMSLGATGTACEGPDVDAVRRLSEKALFVIAAGNSYLHGAISTPGCAAEVLTVGAVDRDESTAPFSSRGPVFAGTTAKPDIASQGVGVVAGRAGGRLDLAYVAHSGTSMATPHVSGGAALLLQASPDLTPTQLKALLTSSSDDTDAAVLDQGAGPMDVERALGQTVTAEPNQTLAELAYPQMKAATTSSITLRNSGERDVVLALAIDDLVGGDRVTSVPKKLIQLGARTVTVPAGGEARVPLTIQVDKALAATAYGTITGRLIATGAGQHVNVPFSIVVEGPAYDLTIKTVDRFGKPAISPSTWSLVEPAQDLAYTEDVSGGTRTIRVPAGVYNLSASIATRDEPTNDSAVASLAVMSRHQVRIDADTTVVFDARQAKKVSFQTDRPSEMFGFTAGWSYDITGTGLRAANLLTAPSYVRELYADSAGKDDAFTFIAATRAYAPRQRLTVDGEAIDYLYAQLAPELTGTGEARIVSPDDPDKSGAIVLSRGDNAWYIADDAAAWARQGAVGVAFSLNGVPGRTVMSANGSPVPVLSITAATADRIAALRADGAVLRWSGHGVTTSPYAYNLVHTQQRAAKAGAIRVSDAQLARETATYASQGDARLLYTDAQFSVPGVRSVYANGSSVAVRAPLTRVDLFTASPDVAWTSVVAPSYANAGGVFDGPRVRTAGDTQTGWLRAPVGASSSTDPEVALFARESNRLQVTLPDFGDADGHDGLGAYPDQKRSSVTIDGSPATYQGGKITMPQSDALVEATVSWTRREGFGAIQWNTGLAYETQWSFRSGARDQGRQNALIPRVEVPADARGRVAAGKELRIRVAASSDRQPGVSVPLNQARLWFAAGTQSAVGAVTDWQEARIARDGDAWVAVLPAQAAESRFLHLKTEMLDASGSKVTQTMIRAAGLE